MKLLANSTPEKNLAELEIRVEGEEFAAALEKSYRKNSAKLNIPGFRKGHAPKGTVLKYVGEEYFYDDAVNESCYDAYIEAVKELAISPVDAPSVDVTEIGHEGYTFKAKVYTKPEIEIDGYKGLKAERADDALSDEELDAELGRMQERASRLVEVADRAAAMGDESEIAYEGFCGGKAFEGGKSDSANLTLGSHQFIPGFEEQIVGHSVGDEFDVNVTFPTEYHAEALAGKDATFKTKLLGLKVKELPALDDDFAKDVSEFDTFTELKEDTRKKLQEAKTKRIDMDVENKLVDAAAELVKGDIPEVMFANKAEDLMEDFGYRLQMQGMDLESYRKYTQQTPEQMKEQFLPEAKRQVRVTLALEKIAELEKIEVAAEDIEKEYNETAERYGVDIAKAKSAIPESEIVSNIRLAKAIDVIRTNAKITKAKAEKKADAKPAEKKAPAKKTAKKTDEKTGE